MNTNLEYYKYFYYVATCGSISAAAEKLCISQPAVSQALKSLEASLGGRLFLRTPKGVKLTHEGNILFSYVKTAYENILQGEDAFRQLLDLDNGEIKIGASDMTLQFYLLPYLEIFHEKYPQIKITVTNAPTPETLSNLKEGKIDFGVITTPFISYEGLIATNVREIKTVFIAGDEYNYLKNKIQPLDILSKLPIISLEKNTSTRAYIDEFLAEKGVFIEPEFELATSDMIVQFTLRNLGVGLVVYDFAKPFIDNNKIFEIKINEKMPKRYFSIVTDRRNVISAPAGKLLDIINNLHS